MAPALVPLTASNASRPSSIRASSTPQVKAPCEPPPCRARLTRLVELIWLFSPVGLRYLHRPVAQERRGRRHYGEGRGTESVAKAPVDHSLDALDGPAHLLGPGLLHLPAVRRADDAGARLVAQRHVRRAVGRPAGRRPELDPGRRLDRPRARPHADDRRLAARRGAPAGVVEGRFAAAVLRAVDRARRLPGRDPLRAGLRRDHPRLRTALQAGDPADDLPRRPGQHLRHSVRPAPDRAHRLAADARGAGRDQPRRRPADPLAVHSRPAGKARADRRGQATGRGR